MHEHMTFWTLKIYCLNLAYFKISPSGANNWESTTVPVPITYTAGEISETI